VAYYDPDADIFVADRMKAAIARSQEQPWGLLDIAEDGRVVGIEVWDASTRLPAELLRATPVVQQQALRSDLRWEPSAVSIGGWPISTSKSAPRGCVFVRGTDLRWRSGQEGRTSLHRVTS
jgi:uncharacterized protein YuzE